MSMTTPDVNNWECFSKAWGHFIWHKKHFNTTLSKEKNELFLPELFAFQLPRLKMFLICSYVFTYSSLVLQIKFVPIKKFTSLEFVQYLEQNLKTFF